MTNLLSTPAPTDEGQGPERAPVAQLFTPRSVPLTDDFTVERALPQRERRLVGPWCFLDHFRTRDAESAHILDVLPHPHIGLQTVTWLFDGAVRHRDSLGSDERIRPGQLNLMTAGRGIVHAERSLPEAASLHGLQLWIALPDSHRDITPAFEHHAELPVIEIGRATARVLAGTFAAHRSPATIYSPLMGIEVSVPRGSVLSLPLDREFEHAVLVIDGDVVIEDKNISAGTLLYLGEARSQLEFEAAEASRMFLFGGVPLREHVLLWWNFVARTNDEMVRAREEWEQRAARFGDVPGYSGARFSAPPLALRLRSD
jgi:redox-sensitive bicupin YhaK (pirin superfamily)